MSKRRISQIAVIVLALCAVLYPLVVRFQNAFWTQDSALFYLFPFFGLLGFTILWLHVISGVFEPWLRELFDFDAFVHYSSLIVLASIILHPLLLLIALRFDYQLLFSYGKPIYIWLGIIGWVFLITYDVGKALQKYSFFVRHWNIILFVSTLGFLLTFFHSIGLGSDLQNDPLRSVWIFYGVTAFIATAYNFGVRKPGNGPAGELKE